jgi:hypothetical protein
MAAMAPECARKNALHEVRLLRTPLEHAAEYPRLILRECHLPKPLIDRRGHLIAADPGSWTMRAQCVRNREVIGLVDCTHLHVKDSRCRTNVDAIKGR